ncbi:MULTISPECIES: TetR family transcriptional regulator [Streptomyces]|uniref:TetR family transcriptional regulator n=1 Tax=Streptomyces TaxID=1883 RepID=UPI000B9E5D82|nr:TetR family transcriptional regulator [Streptomyces sp. SID7805]
MALVLWGDRTRHTVRGEDLGGTGSRRAVRAARGGKSGHGEAAHTAARHGPDHREALALIDAEGADAFSLPRLAARLGIRTPSLYHHVTGRAAVVEGVRRLVTRRGTRLSRRGGCAVAVRRARARSPDTAAERGRLRGSGLLSDRHDGPRRPAAAALCR